jgi:hypothetical protein
MPPKDLTATNAPAASPSAHASADVMAASVPPSVGVALAVPPAAVLVAGALMRPVGTGGSYFVARGSTDPEHVVKPPAGADPTRDPEAARPRPPDSSGT